MRNHVQRGDTLPIIAPFDVTSGSVLQVDGIVGVVNAHAMAGTECEITRYGVFELPKAAGEVWSTGDRVYHTEGDAFLRLAGGALVGCAVQDAGSEDVLAYVLLDGAVRDSSPIALIMVPDPPMVGEAFTVIANLQDGVTLSSITATAGGTPIALTGSGNTRTGTAPAEAGPLVVTATGADADGNPLTANRTVQVREEPVGPPTVITAPTITGTPTVGQTLTASEGTWTGSPTLALQWLRNGTAISGATGATYLLIAADAGANISLRVTATNAGGSTTATSASVGPVQEGEQPGDLPDWSDVDAIVFIGASHELGMFGTSSVSNPSTATPSAEATAYLAGLGLNLPVYCFATGGTTSAVHNTHYAAARGQFPNALIFSGFGGNDVSEVINAGQSYATMTTEQRATIQGRLDAISGSSVGSDDHYMPYFVSFRNYNGVALANPELGSDPFNTGIFKDWMQSNWPWAIHADGRARFDLYRFTRTLQGYLTSNDGYIHPTGTFHGEAIGYQLWREWLLRQVHSLLTSGTTERPADYVPAIGVDDFYIDFQSSAAANPGRNTVDFSTSGVFPVTGLALVGTDNVALPYTADIVLPETAVAGGTSVNSYAANASSVTDASFSAADRWFSGNPWSFSTTAANLYMCANVTVTVTIKGLPANTDYEITAAGLRVASTTTGIVKLTSGANEAQYESIIAAEAGEQDPLARSAKVIGRSDASGNLVAVLSNAGGQYARVNGIGFKRVA